MKADITLKNYRCFSDDKPARFQIGDGDIAFVGPNNAGKSTILRFFYEFRPTLERLSTPKGLKNAMSTPNEPTALPESVRDPVEIFHDGNNRDLEVRIAFPDPVPQTNDRFGIVRSMQITVSRTGGLGQSVRLSHEDGETSSGTAYSISSDGNLSGTGLTRVLSVTQLNEVCRNLCDTVYVGPFRSPLSVPHDGAYFDIQIGQRFMSIWDERKRGRVKIAKERVREVTRELQEVFQFSSLDIGAAQDGKVFDIRIGEKDYSLNEIGAGFAHFLIVLGNLILRKPAYVLIDEPELNLHPKLQLRFLEAIQSRATKGVLFATHSVGLARAAADQVYYLQNEDRQGTIMKPLEATQSLSELLGEMSFSAYREIGCDGVLLVEGKTDAQVARQFLRQYRKDHHYLVLPLHGDSSITPDARAEIQELHRLTENTAVLIDRETDSEGAPVSKKRQEFRKMCEEIGVPCHILERRAIENYFPERAIRAVKGDKYRALEPYEKLADLEFGWGKRENWRIVQKMNLADLEGTDLGEFFESLP